MFSCLKAHIMPNDIFQYLSNKMDTPISVNGGEAAAVYRFTQRPFARPQATCNAIYEID